MDRSVTAYTVLSYNLGNYVLVKCHYNVRACIEIGISIGAILLSHVAFWHLGPRWRRTLQGCFHHFALSLKDWCALPT